MVGPDLDEVAEAAELLAGVIIETPILPLKSARWDSVLPDCASVTLKLSSSNKPDPSRRAARFSGCAVWQMTSAARVSWRRAAGIMRWRCLGPQRWRV